MSYRCCGYDADKTAVTTSDDEEVAASMNNKLQKLPCFMCTISTNITVSIIFKDNFLF